MQDFCQWSNAINQFLFFSYKCKGLKRMKAESLSAAEIPTCDIDVQWRGINGPEFVFSFTVVPSIVLSCDSWDCPLGFFFIRLRCVVFKPFECERRISFGRTSQSHLFSFLDCCWIHCCHHVFGSICSRGRKDADVKREKKRCFATCAELSVHFWEVVPDTHAHTHTHVPTHTHTVYTVYTYGLTCTKKHLLTFLVVSFLLLNLDFYQLIQVFQNRFHSWWTSFKDSNY